MKVRKSLLGAALGGALLVAGCGNATVHHVTSQPTAPCTEGTCSGSNPCINYILANGQCSATEPSPSATPTPAATPTPTPVPTPAPVLYGSMYPAACTGRSDAASGDWGVPLGPGAILEYGDAEQAVLYSNGSTDALFAYSTLAQDATTISNDLALQLPDAQAVATYDQDLAANAQYFAGC